MPFFSSMLALILCLWLGSASLQAQDARRIGMNDQQVYPSYAPVLSPDGTLFIYSELGNRANFGRADLADIWICQLVSEGQWGRPVNIGMPVNTDQNDQCLAINLDQNELFLLQESDHGEKKIAQSKLNFRSWSTPQPMQVEPWDSAYQIQHGFISHDGQTLLLCITRSDSIPQQSDIYVAQREGEFSWKNLQSLGPTINTSGREQSAFLAADGTTLYFASNGHGGFGGQDIFISRRRSNSWSDWSPPKNLGPTFNGTLDDWGFFTSVIGTEAWWTRSDNNSPSIQNALIPIESRAESVILVKGQVFLPQSKTPAPNVSISLNYFDTQRNTRLQRQGLSDPRGRYQFLLPKNTEMIISATSGNLFSPTYNFLRTGPAILEKEDFEEKTIALLKNPAYQQLELQIEALQLAYNQNQVLLKKLNKDREKYVEAILSHWEDTISLNFSKNSEVGLVKLREEYEAIRKQQSLLKFHEESPKKGDHSTAFDLLIPTEFESFVRLIEIQQRWEILPATAHFLILQMLNEEIKKRDKEIKPEDRNVWKKQKEQILKNPDLLLLPEKELVKWRGIFSPCFEWQETVAREISNFLLPKNQTELTTEIKNDVRNYLQNVLEMRFLAAQSSEIAEETLLKIKSQRDMEEAFRYQNPEQPTASEPWIDTLQVSANLEFDRDIQLFDPLSEKTIILENLFFLPNQSELDSVSYAEIYHLANFLKANPTLRIEILAHTNSRTSHEFADDLTNRRAEKIANLLIQEQISPERVSGQGVGKKRPIASNNLLVGRRTNQRIEIVFIN